MTRFGQSHCISYTIDFQTVEHGQVYKKNDLSEEIIGDDEGDEHKELMHENNNISLDVELCF